MTYFGFKNWAVYGIFLRLFETLTGRKIAIFCEFYLFHFPIFNRSKKNVFFLSLDFDRIFFA